ncbi:MAG: hypothetical protein HY673_04755 [Chloroflexi bacterium]|nr:hypothetical protein [Chloroflexota bacterium]
MKVPTNDFAVMLGLREWPFGVVPDPDKTLIWADRRELLNQLNRLMRRIKGNPASTLHLLWADFGAGKTHTLLYLRQNLLSAKSAILPVYAVLPKETRSFVDVYRAIASSLTIEKLIEIYRVSSKTAELQNAGPLIGEKWNDVLTVLRALSIGSDSVVESAKKWMLADQSLTRQELFSTSLPDKIRTVDDAIAVVSSIFRLMSIDSSRVVLMIDEFQRTGRLRTGIRNDIQAGLRTFFNNCPTGLSIVLSFKFGAAKEVETYLSEELRDLADPQVIMIPVLDQGGAKDFLTDLVEQVKVPGTDCRIQQDAIASLVESVSTVGTLKPRLITKTASLLFSEGAMDIEDGLVDSIDAVYVCNKFKQSRSTIENIDAEQED